MVYSVLGSEDSTQSGDQANKQQQQRRKQQSVTKHEKGFLQQLRDVFWKPKEKEPKVEVLDRDKQDTG